jgi:putative redox protein
MVTIHSKYLGNLRTESEHLNSKAQILTDAPLDNKGKGEAFSPTDLLASCLGSCMMTIMGITAQEHNFQIEGTEMDITKIMQNSPRKVSEILVEINFPKQKYTDREKQILEKSALTCPVYLSLHPDLKKSVNFNFQD